MTTLAPAAPLVAAALARSIAPRKALTVSEWADANRYLSSKGSAKPGKWRTSDNPPLREPMDCMSARSNVREVTLMFPIQFGKTEIAINTLGYCMDHHPGPVMVCLPSEDSQSKWVAQKLNPMLEESEAVHRTLVSVDSRNSANTRTFKDFIGGQLYINHAGSPGRLKQTSVRTLIVDELDDFAANLVGGDDPIDMLEGRTSAFPNTCKRLYISSPQMLGTSRIHRKFMEGDQRRRYVPCPHCAHRQPLEWSGLQWTPDAAQCWYVCRECSCVIDEHEKTAMIARGEWVPENPGAESRSYTVNCLYYQIGLGPRWLDLVKMWRAAQNDPARLKTFINDRLAEPFEDPAMRQVKHNVIAERVEKYHLRVAPLAVLAATAGVDTQDDRLEVHIIGWSRTLAAWTLDYHVISGDPANDETWVKLVDLLSKPIEHASGAILRIDAVAIDAGGHRTESVKSFVRKGLVRRPMAIFGAVPNNAPVLGKGKLQDINWRGVYDKRGVTTYQVGTVGIKHLLYSRISTDTDKTTEARSIHLSEDLPPEYFAGLVSETYNPVKNRFEKKSGTRNEVLDTWVYAFAAAHHPELRLHRRTRLEWDAIESHLLGSASRAVRDSLDSPKPPPAAKPASPPPPRRGGFVDDWSIK